MQGEYIQISGVVRRVGSQSAAVGKGRPWEENEGGGRKGNVERSTTNSSPAVATSVESCRWDMCGKGSGRDV